VDAGFLPPDGKPVEWPFLALALAACTRYFDMAAGPEYHWAFFSGELRFTMGKPRGQPPDSVSGAGSCFAFKQRPLDTQLVTQAIVERAHHGVRHAHHGTAGEGEVFEAGKGVKTLGLTLDGLRYNFSG